MTRNQIYRRARGFTIIELLVTMAITGILVALISAGVMSARESARRVDCLSRMSQLGRALHGFEGTHRHFPSACDAISGRPEPANSYSPHSRLLPYLDQVPLFNLIEFDIDIFFSAPQTPVEVASHVVPVFNCPSDTPLSGCSFRACTGKTAYSYTVPAPYTQHHRADGAFTVTERHTAGEFTDGLSHTIAFSEKTKGHGVGGPWGRGAYWRSGFGALAGLDPSTESIRDACASLTTTPAFFGPHAGHDWLIGCWDYTLYNHVVPPNSRISDCSTGTGSNPGEAWYGVFTARSYHSGGVNCVYMDGSGRFASNSVDLGVWQAIATRAGNELNHDF